MSLRWGLYLEALRHSRGRLDGREDSFFLFVMSGTVARAQVVLDEPGVYPKRLLLKRIHPATTRGQPMGPSQTEVSNCGSWLNNGEVVLHTVRAPRSGPCPLRTLRRDHHGMLDEMAIVRGSGLGPREAYAKPGATGPEL